MTGAAFDRDHMRHALALARRGLGRVWPNPAVGCVLINAGRVVGRGRTADGGRPHAEVAALKMAGSLAKRATAYVTLEPCAHHGETPPCADALIDAGVSRVVVALTSLSALALMADGSTDGRGRHGMAVRRAVNFLLKLLFLSLSMTLESALFLMLGARRTALVAGATPLRLSMRRHRRKDSTFSAEIKVI